MPSVLSAPLSRVNLQCLSYLGRWVKAGRATSGATHTLGSSPSISSTSAPLVYHVWEAREEVEIKMSLGKMQSHRMDSLASGPASPPIAPSAARAWGGRGGVAVGGNHTGWRRNTTQRLHLQTPWDELLSEVELFHLMRLPLTWLSCAPSSSIVRLSFHGHSRHSAPVYSHDVLFCLPPHAALTAQLQIRFFVKMICGLLMPYLFYKRKIRDERGGRRAANCCQSDSNRGWQGTRAEGWATGASPDNISEWVSSEVLRQEVQLVNKQGTKLCLRGVPNFNWTALSWNAAPFVLKKKKKYRKGAIYGYYMGCDNKNNSNDNP